MGCIITSTGYLITNTQLPENGPMIIGEVPEGVLSQLGPDAIYRYQSEAGVTNFLDRRSLHFNNMNVYFDPNFMDPCVTVLPFQSEVTGDTRAKVNQIRRNHHVHIYLSEYLHADQECAFEIFLRNCSWVTGRKVVIHTYNEDLRINTGDPDLHRHVIKENRFSVCRFRWDNNHESRCHSYLSIGWQFMRHNMLHWTQTDNPPADESLRWTTHYKETVSKYRQKGHGRNGSS